VNLRIGKGRRLKGLYLSFPFIEEGRRQKAEGRR
jgi:hypothetical protein